MPVPLLTFAVNVALPFRQTEKVAGFEEMVTVGSGTIVIVFGELSTVWTPSAQASVTTTL